MFARIVCVANHFDRLRQLGDGTAQPRVRVLKQMLCSSLTTRFDPVILGALPLVVPAFPPGTMVTLNSGEKGIVVDWHPEAPCQPTLQALERRPETSSRKTTAPRIIDLRQNASMMIVEHDGIDVSRDGFRLVGSADSRQKNAA